jgi:GTP1/Obg family GTP-binding protein
MTYQLTARNNLYLTKKELAAINTYISEQEEADSLKGFKEIFLFLLDKAQNKGAGSENHTKLLSQISELENKVIYLTRKTTYLKSENERTKAPIIKPAGIKAPPTPPTPQAPEKTPQAPEKPPFKLYL